MAELLDDITYLSQEVGPRPAGTEEEQQAALFIADQVHERTGFHAEIEDIKCMGDAAMIDIIYYGIALFFLALAFFVPTTSIVAMVITALNAVLFLVERFGRIPLLARLFTRDISQNVVVKYQPSTSNVERPVSHRKIVVVTNYDSGRVRFEAKPKLVNVYAFFMKAGMLSLVLTPILILVKNVLLAGSVDAVAALATLLCVVALVLLLIALAVSIAHRVAPYNEAANNNASSVAIMLEALKHLDGSAVDEGEPRSRSVRAEEEAPVVHGESAARAAGVVPAGAALTYEADQAPAAQGDKAPESPVPAEAPAAVEPEAAPTFEEPRDWPIDGQESVSWDEASPEQEEQSAPQFAPAAPVEDLEPAGDTAETRLRSAKAAIAALTGAPVNDDIFLDLGGSEAPLDTATAHAWRDSDLKQEQPEAEPEQEQATPGQPAEAAAADAAEQGQVAADADAPQQEEAAASEPAFATYAGYAASAPSVPDWFAAAKARARTQGAADAEPVKRSQYADALDSVKPAQDQVSAGAAGIDEQTEQRLQQMRDDFAGRSVAAVRPGPVVSQPVADGDAVAEEPAEIAEDVFGAEALQVELDEPTAPELHAAEGEESAIEVPPAQEPASAEPIEVEAQVAAEPAAEEAGAKEPVELEVEAEEQAQGEQGPAQEPASDGAADERVEVEFEDEPEAEAGAEADAEELPEDELDEYDEYEEYEDEFEEYEHGGPTRRGDAPRKGGMFSRIRSAVLPSRDEEDEEYYDEEDAEDFDDVMEADFEVLEAEFEVIDDEEEEPAPAAEADEPEQEDQDAEDEDEAEDDAEESEEEDGFEGEDFDEELSEDDEEDYDEYEEEDEEAYDGYDEYGEYDYDDEPSRFSSFRDRISGAFSRFTNRIAPAPDYEEDYSYREEDFDEEDAEGYEYETYEGEFEPQPEDLYTDTYYEEPLEEEPFEEGFEEDAYGQAAYAEGSYGEDYAEDELTEDEFVEGEYAEGELVEDEPAEDEADEEAAAEEEAVEELPIDEPSYQAGSVEAFDEGEAFEDELAYDEDAPVEYGYETEGLEDEELEAEEHVDEGEAYEEEPESEEPFEEGFELEEPYQDAGYAAGQPEEEPYGAGAYGEEPYEEDEDYAYDEMREQEEEGRSGFMGAITGWWNRMMGRDEADDAYRSYEDEVFFDDEALAESEQLGDDGYEAMPFEQPAEAPELVYQVEYSARRAPITSWAGAVQEPDFADQGAEFEEFEGAEAFEYDEAYEDYESSEPEGTFAPVYSYDDDVIEPAEEEAEEGEYVELSEEAIEPEIAFEPARAPEVPYNPEEELDMSFQQVTFQPEEGREAPVPIPASGPASSQARPANPRAALGRRPVRQQDSWDEEVIDVISGEATATPDTTAPFEPVGQATEALEPVGDASALEEQDLGFEAQAATPDRTMAMPPIDVSELIGQAPAQDEQAEDSLELPEIAEFDEVAEESEADAAYLDFDEPDGVRRINLPEIPLESKQAAPLAEIGGVSAPPSRQSLGATIPSIDAPAFEPKPLTPNRFVVDEGPSHTDRVRALRDNLPSMTSAVPAVTAEPENELVSQTGSFAAVGAAGAMEPVTDSLVEDLPPEEIYVDDADDAFFDESPFAQTETGAYVASDYVQMPQKRSFFGFRSQQKQSDEVSPQEWLGVSDDFDAREVGKARGDWSSFRENDARGSVGDRDYPDLEEEFEQDSWGSGPSYYGPQDYDTGIDNAFRDDENDFLDEDYGMNNGRWNGGAFSGRRSGERDTYTMDDYDEYEEFAEYADENYDENAFLDEDAYEDVAEGSGQGGRFSALTSRFSRRDKSSRNAADEEDAEDRSRSSRRRNEASASEVDAWNVAAARAAERSAVANALDDPRVQEEIGRTYNFVDEPIDNEVWFVALGAGSADNAGMREFLEQHRDELHGALVFNLEGIGDGELTSISNEGFTTKCKPTTRMKRFLRNAGQATGIRVDQERMNWRDTPATEAMRKGLSAITVAGMENGVPVNYASSNDVAENLDESKLKQRVTFILELLRSI